MLRRFLCLGALLLLIVVGVAACGSSGKSSSAKTVVDPDAGARPKPAGAKGG